MLVQEGLSGDHQSGLRLEDEHSHSDRGTPGGAGIYYMLAFLLVLASCKHLNGQHDKPSVLIPVQTQLSFPGLSI